MEKLPTIQVIHEQMPEALSHFKAAQMERPKREHVRALIIEDQPSSCLLLSQILRGYQVDVAHTAEEGLKTYLDKAPDIAFVDIRLADDTGHNLARLIKEFDPQSYIVMVTGSNSIEDVKSAKDNHVEGYVLKPYTQPKIQESIKNYFETRRK